MEILPNVRDHSRFDSLQALAQDVRHHGYYGGVRLLKATARRFHDYCVQEDPQPVAGPEFHGPL